MQRKGKQRPLVLLSKVLVPQHGCLMPFPPIAPTLSQFPTHIPMLSFDA